VSRIVLGRVMRCAGATAGALALLCCITPAVANSASGVSSDTTGLAPSRPLGHAFGVLAETAPSRSGGPRATTARGCPYATRPVWRASEGELRSAVVCLIDRFRRMAGLPRLRQQGQLDEAAQSHDDQMVARRFFGHGGIPASSPASRIGAAGFNWGAFGEAISTGFRTPRGAVLGWLRSTEHCQILLSPSYSRIGIGVNPHPVAGWTWTPGTWTADLALPLGRRAPSGNWGPADHCPY
jgi:uncharacterized protein YkwD